MKKTNLFRRWYSELLRNKVKLFVAILLFIISLIIFDVSGSYVTRAGEGFVSSPDLILDNFSPIDLNFVFGGVFLIISFFVYLFPLIYYPGRYYYYLIMFSMLTIVRAGFIVLTHLKTPETAIAVQLPWIFNNFFSSNDVFFSGHVAMPFLGYLIFKNKWLKSIMLILSLIMAFTVLIMHRHYSIDVAAAYFITYGVYKIGNKICNYLERGKN